MTSFEDMLALSCSVRSFHNTSWPLSNNFLNALETDARVCHRKVSSRFKFRFTFDRLSLDIQDQFCPYLSFDRYSNSYLTFIRYSLYIQFTFVRHSSLVSTTICLSSGISFLTLPSLDIHYTFSSHSLDIQVWCQTLFVFR